VNAKSWHQNRDFSRVCLTVPVTVTSTIPTPVKQKISWSLCGQVIVLTGSGILVSLPKKPPVEDSVRLEFSLPTVPPEDIKIRAHPIRSLPSDDNQWNVAYRFDTISEEDRDKIIGCCLVEQRRMLRLDHGIIGSV
jgi:hypothetical protein